MNAEEKKAAIMIIREKVRIYSEFFFNSYEESPYYPITEGCVASNNLTAMRYISREIDGGLRENGEEVAAPIRQKIREELGDAAFTEKKKNDRTLQKIIKSGVIKTENEYRMVHEQVESIWDHADKKEEYEKLSELLAACTTKWL